MIKSRATIAALATVALTASLAGAALAQDEPEPTGGADIEGLTWLLTSQMVDGAMVETPERVTVSLLMDGGQAGGNAGCNSYFTSYELDGPDLTFGQVGSTMMACLPPIMDLEQAYFANLGQVRSYQSGDTGLSLLDADGGSLLEFEAAPPESVVGSWVATGINNQAEAVVTTAITEEITAEFSPDGDLTGFDGCNSYFTTYVVDGEAISIDPAIGQTMMACPSDAHAEQSQAYIAALTNAATWSVDATGNLELRDTEGALQVGYAPAE